MRPLPAFAAALAGLALPACQADPVLGVETASIVVNPAPGRPAAGYFVLKGGPVDEVLEFASVPYAGRTEMHETVSVNGAMTMRAIERVPVPARSTVRFEPGGRHLMIYGLSPSALKEGRTQIVLRFSDGSQAFYRAFVRTQGQAIE